MFHAGCAGFIVIVKKYRVTRQGLKGKRSDKFGGCSGHYNTHFSACLYESAGEVGGFVGGNAASDADYDVFAV